MIRSVRFEEGVYCVASSETRPKKPDRFPKGAIAIIEKAEEMIGSCGLASVSMRQIAAAAGLGSPSAVQYHFGDMDGLIDAVYRYRMPYVEARRAELLAALDAADRKNLKCLLHATLLPLAEIKNSKAICSYALFAAEMGYSSFVSAGWIRATVSAKATQALIDLTKAEMPPARDEIKNLKISMAYQMILRTIGGAQKVRELASVGLDLDRVFDLAITMAAAGLRTT